MKSMNNILRIILVVVIILGIFAVSAFLESPGNILKIGFIFIVLLGAFAVAAFYITIKSKMEIRKKQKRLGALLDGRTIDAVLAAAPYAYSHFQGDDGYRIWDKRAEKNDFFVFTSSVLDAELWIVEKYLSEYQDA